MSTLSRRGAYANQPAQLPGIQTARIGDANVRQAVESLREWVEVRLGARGDVFERAVTTRDLTQAFDRLDARLKELERGLTGSSSGAPSSGGSSQSTNTSELATLQRIVLATQNDVTQLKTLLASENILARLEVVEAALGSVSGPRVYEISTEFGTALPDMALGDEFVVLLTDDVFVAAPAEASNGQSFKLLARQDGVGGHSVTFAPEYVFADALTPTVPSAPGTSFLLEATYSTGSVGTQILVTSFSSFSSSSPLVGFSSSISYSSAWSPAVPGAASGAAVVAGAGFQAQAVAAAVASSQTIGVGASIFAATAAAAGTSSA